MFFYLDDPPAEDTIWFVDHGADTEPVSSLWYKFCRIKTKFYYHEIVRNSFDFARSCSVDSTQSLSPNFMHSPPTAARAIGRQRRLTETSQGVGGGRVVELMGCSQVSQYTVHANNNCCGDLF